MCVNCVKCAGELAYHGHRVKMYDANTDSLNSAYERIEEDKQHLRQDGLLPQLNFIVCVFIILNICIFELVHSILYPTFFCYLLSAAAYV